MSMSCERILIRNNSVKASELLSIVQKKREDRVAYCSDKANSETMF